ncbi:MAG: hypothetical protein QME51_08710 [Planctomycetota bacterium]|nr:hypothetical protein [Planctomycetota bacterium]
MDENMRGRTEQAQRLEQSPVTFVAWVNPRDLVDMTYLDIEKGIVNFYGRTLMLHDEEIDDRYISVRVTVLNGKGQVLGTE